MRDALLAHGVCVHKGVVGAVAAARDPWGFAERVLGYRPRLVERQPIRPIPNGRSWASGTMAAPFHTDSQLALGVPPALQLMLCVRPASRGGACLFVDTWALLEVIERDDPPLFDALFDVDRRFSFVFGDVVGPTVSERGGHLVFTHTALATDDVARRLRPFVERAAVTEIRAEAGDLVVSHNHRMLHGRTAFDDPRREFTRLLVWPKEALPAPPRFLARARGVSPEAPPRTLTPRERAVAEEMLRGTPPGLLSAREGVREPLLYRWRDAVLLQSPGS